MKKRLKKALSFYEMVVITSAPPELRFLKDLEKWCYTAIHLQCAAGHDTLSLLNLGAHRVIGVDISDKMIELVRKKCKNTPNCT